MTNEEVRFQVQRMLQGEIDNCDRAIREGDLKKATQELEKAVAKIKRVVVAL